MGIRITDFKGLRPFIAEIVMLDDRYLGGFSYFPVGIIMAKDKGMAQKRAAYRWPNMSGLVFSEWHDLTPQQRAQVILQEEKSLSRKYREKGSFLKDEDEIVF